MKKKLTRCNVIEKCHDIWSSSVILFRTQFFLSIKPLLIDVFPTKWRTKWSGER